MKRSRFLLVTPLVAMTALLALAGGFIVVDALIGYSADSDVSYLILGCFSLLLSALFASAALLAVSWARYRWGWFVLAVLGLLATAVLYTGMIGSVGYALQVALALLAVGSALAYLVGSGRGRAGKRI